MKVPKEASKLSRALFQRSLSEGRLDAAKVSAVVQQTIERKPRHYLAALKNYLRLVRLELAKRHALIQSATPLDSALGSELETGLRARYGTDITTEFQVNPDLLGGIRIRFGSDVLDNSIQGRLNTLRDQLDRP